METIEDCFNLISAHFHPKDYPLETWKDLCTAFLVGRGFSFDESVNKVWSMSQGAESFHKRNK